MTKAPIATFFSAAQDNRGVSYTGDWSTLAARLARIDRGTKEGPAFTCGNFGGNTRSRAHLVSRTLVALDIEASKMTGEVPPPLPATMERIRRKRSACVGYESFSSTQELPRYRLVFPLDAPVDLAEHAALDREIARQVAIELGVAGVTDTSKLGAESLFYFGRTAVRPEDRLSFVLDGASINGADLVARAATATYGQAMEEASWAALKRASGFDPAVAMGESEQAAPRRASELDPAVADVIVAFNEAHPLTQMLERYSYIWQGGRWKSRHQGAGSIGATWVAPGGRWISYSESDREAGVGRPTNRDSQAACSGDAFDLFVHYEYGGNFAEALCAASCRALGTPGPRAVLAVGREATSQAMAALGISYGLAFITTGAMAWAQLDRAVRFALVVCSPAHMDEARRAARFLHRAGIEARVKVRTDLPRESERDSLLGESERRLVPNPSSSESP